MHNRGYILLLDAQKIASKQSKISGREGLSIQIP